MTISNITGNGTLGIAIAASSAVDLAGNPAPAATSGTFTVDNTAVGISISSPSKSITNTAGEPVTFTVSYSDPVFASSSLSSADVQLVATGTATGTLSFDTGTGSLRTVTITNISGDGTLGIAIPAGSGLDQAGNVSPAATSGTFIVDNTAPSVTLSTPSATITSTAGGPISYTVTYADSNFGTSNLTLAEISLNATGTANGTIALSGSGKTYTVTIGSLTGNGTLGFTIAAGSAVDQAGNVAAATSSAAFTLDNLPPTVNISAPSALYTATASVSYTVSYVSGYFGSSSLTASDIALNATGTATGSIGVTGRGHVVHSDDQRHQRQRYAGLLDDRRHGCRSGRQPGTAGRSCAATFTVDNPPVGIAVSGPSKTITGSGSVSYTVTYPDADFASSSLTTSNVHLVSTGTATGTLSFDTGTGATRTVTISNITGSGTLGIAIDAGSAVDLAGNQAPAVTKTTNFIVYNTAPAVTISHPSSTYGSAVSGPIIYTVRYSDPYFASSSLTASNITLNATGTANGSISVSGSGTVYTVTISTITGNGTLGISVAAGTAVDQAGNVASAAGPSGTFIVDDTPVGISISAPSATLTGLTPVTYTITYSDPYFAASNLTLANVHLVSTGTATGTISIDNSTGTTRTVTVTPTGGTGTLAIAIDAVPPSTLPATWRRPRAARRST